MQKKRSLKQVHGNIEANDVITGTFETSSGSIKVGNIENARIEASSGNIRAGNTKKIIASTSSGTIRIESISESCDISANSGGVKIEECNLTENSNIKVKSGGVRIGKVNNVFINAKAKSGTVKVPNTDGKLEIELNIETTSGSIKVGE